MKYYGLIVLVLCGIYARAQKPIVAIYIDTESAHSADFLGKNSFGTAFYLRDSRVLVEQQREVQREYQNLLLGEIATVDWVNPMQLLLFYKNFNTAMLLDRELAPVKEINFSDINPNWSIDYIGNSSQNRIWIFESQKNQLGLLSLINSQWVPLGQPITESVVYTASEVNFFYCITASGQLYLTDVNGQTQSLGLVPQWNAIQILNRREMLYLKEGALYLYNWNTQQNSLVSVAEKSICGFFFNNQILSIFTANQIKNYHLILP